MTSPAAGSARPVRPNRPPREFDLRDGKDLDLDFIESTWVECMRDASPHCRGIESAIYYPHQRATIRRALARASICCAVDPKDTDVIWGYVVFEPVSPPVVHFVYVKQKFRNEGIGRALLIQALGGVSLEHPFIATQYTDRLAALLRLKKIRVIINPYHLTES
jgi:hypothetical protein